MSTSQNTVRDHTEWWAALGLDLAAIGPESLTALRGTELLQEVLAKHPPVVFAGDSDEQTLTLEQLLDRIRLTADPIEQALANQERSTAAERERFGWERVEEALNTADAQLQITEGRWAGFTKGEARAWCWNLMQYEPKGFAMPGMYTRRGAVKELAAGGLPEVFHHPERARELANQGLDPREYRRRQEAANAPTFCEADVTIEVHTPTN